MSIKEFAVLIMVCLFWGLHFVVMRVTMGTIAPPLFYVAFRMSLLTILLFPFLKWHPGKMKFIFPAALGYGTFNYAFMFPAMTLTTATAAAVAIELYMPFSILLSLLIFKDKIGIYRTLGIVLAFAGVMIVAVSTPSEAAGPYFLLGIFFIICAAMSEAIGAVFVKKAAGVGPLHLLAWFSLIGMCILWPMSFLIEGVSLQAFTADNRLHFILAMIYSTIGVSLIAHSSYYWLLQRLPIYVVATSGLLTTLVGVCAGAILLKEPLSLWIMLGAGLAIFGIALLLWRQKQRVIAQTMSVSGPYS